ncbi:flagellar biosynthetic protein FliO [Ensifer aridi]|uniref:flagellar biosynthetic protein FliO n=1 Tax=Ensifer aridi TaxID=1708715 RepID=UPI00358FCB4D
MMETILGDNGSRFIIAAGAVAIGLLCLVAVLWIMRNRPSSPFVRGGKNRQPRLAVLDAAAVDTRRRLVLVRRDDVEHLIMIGGPTDVVIESRIVSEEAAPASAGVRVAAEQRPADTPTAAARPEAKPQPVSSTAPAELAAVEPVRQMTRPVEPVKAPVRAEPAPPVRVAADQSETASSPPQQPAVSRPAPLPSDVPPVATAVEPVRHVLTAARDRVLPLVQPASGDRSVPPNPAEPFKPVLAQPGPTRPATPDAAEFERMLDAEISGDLQRLTPTAPLRPENRPAQGGRREPMLGATPEDLRKEPTIEEEMNRMLADISAGRKP